MSNREKIIVACAGLMVFYGIYTFIPIIFKSSPSPAKKATKGQDPGERPKVNIDDFVLKTTKEIREIVSKMSIHILSEASAQWNHDPFAKSPLKSEPAIQQTRKLIEELQKLRYSGYIETGDNVLAIIEGMEYAVGEELLNHSACVVTEISPEKVTITIKEEEEKVTLMFEDEE